MTAQHHKTRAKRYSSREHDIKTRRQAPPPPETECLYCGATIRNRGSELCDNCEPG